MFSSLSSRDFFAELDRLQQVLRQDIETSSPTIRGFTRGFPALNVGTTADAVEVYVFAPGMDPQKIEVELDRQVLTISGERANDVASDDAKANVHLHERFGGRFRRVISLPEDIDPSAVSADYRDGVLSVKVKREEATRPRRINVQ
jgi:HSP20 family protein